MIPAGIGPVKLDVAHLPAEHLSILDHTVHRAAGGLYCGGGKAMKELVGAGLMASAGRKAGVPDEYFRITAAGRTVLRAKKGGAS